MARRGGLREELRRANAEAQRERDRRRALRSWARARASGAVGVKDAQAGGNGDVATAHLRKGERAPDTLEQMSGEAAAEAARKPESRFKVLTTPGGITFAILIVLLALWPYVLPGFNASTFLEVQRILVFAMVVMGLNLVAGYAGQLSLGQKIFVLIGGYTVGVLTTRYDTGILGNHWIALIFAVVLGMGSGRCSAFPPFASKAPICRSSRWRSCRSSTWRSTARP